MKINLLHLPMVLALALPLLFSACGEKVSVESLDMKQLKQAAELGTVECTINKVFAITDDSWNLLGNRIVLFQCRAAVKAGIDMEKYNTENAKVEKDKITITLPAPEIFSYNIPPDEIKEIFNDVGALRSDFSQKERDVVFQQAEAEIKGDEEINNTILKEARESSRTFFETLLKQNGFNEVNINFEN